MQLKSKLPNIGTTIFTVMSQMANEYDSINLGQGFPDFKPDESLIEAVSRAMTNGHNQYPPMPGIPKLRNGIAEKISYLYDHAYDINDEITVTSGASEALFASIMAFVNSGDEVVIIEPFYDLYIPAIKLAGGTPVVVPMIRPNFSNGDNSNYKVDWDAVKNSINNKTKMIIVNFPHNPTGITMKDSDLDALEDIINDTGIIILSDEVYEHVVFYGNRHLSLSSRPSLADNSIVVSSFGKTYHITGWKVGYCTAPKKLMNEIRKVHQFNVFTVPTPFQVALAEYLSNKDHYNNLSAFYQKKHDLLFNGLKSTKFSPLASEGTFFLLARYNSISNLSELDFVKWLTKEIGVTAIPVSAFYANPESTSANSGLIRFCFAKEDETLNKAIAKLREI